ncbi:MAG: glycosyltransferase [Nitrosarchaeum sp.]|nr:glycosyltransferase [Nitrosarchaeum sp.]
MKILYVTSGMNFELRRNSVELIIIRELQKRGHQITIISTDINPYSGKVNKNSGSNYEKLTQNQNETIEINKIPVYVLHCSLPKSFGVYCPNASDLAKRIISDYDVIHIASWYHHPGLVFSKIALKHKIPYVFSGYAVLQPENRNYRKIQKWLFDQFFTKKMISNASGLHSVGNKESSAYIELGATNEKIHRIDPAISHEDLEIKKHTKILEKIGISEQKQYLLFLGRILQRKRIELIIYTFAKLIKTKKDLILVIAGPSENLYDQKLKQLTRELGIEEHVRFPGVVLDDEKIEMLRHAKILIHTAKGDIHPLSVEEALTIGIPVIITDCDMPEVSEYNAGMVVEPNTDSIYDALVILLNNEGLWKNFSQNAIKLASEMYRVSSQAKKYEEMYIEAMKNKS